MFPSQRMMTILAVAIAVLVSFKTPVTYAVPIQPSDVVGVDDIALVIVGGIISGVVSGLIVEWVNRPAPPPGTPSAFADVSATAGSNIQDPVPVSVFPPSNVAATATAPAIGELGTESRATLVVTNPNPGTGNVGSYKTANSSIIPALDDNGRIIESGSYTLLGKTDGEVVIRKTVESPATAALVNTPEIVPATLGVTVKNVGQFDTFTAGSEKISSDFSIKVNALSPVSISGGYTIQADPTTVSVLDVRGMISRADINITGRQFTVSENLSQIFNAALDAPNGVTFLASGFAEVIAAPEPSTLALVGTGFIGLFGYGWRRKHRT